MGTEHYLVSTDTVQVYTTFKKRRGEHDGVIWVCERCTLFEDNLELDNRGDLMTHLAAHQKRGDEVPEEVFLSLAREISKEVDMTIMTVGVPPWQNCKHRPTRVRAFRWDRTMGECIPEISALGNSFILTNTWDSVTALLDGMWIVQSPSNEIWVVSGDRFDRWYEHD